MSSTKCSGSPANSGGGGVGSGSWIADRLPLQEGHAVTIIQEAISLQTGARGVPGEEGGRTTVGNYKGSGSPANSGRRGRWQRQLDGRQAAVAGRAGSDDHPGSHQPAKGVEKDMGFICCQSTPRTTLMSCVATPAPKLTSLSPAARSSGEAGSNMAQSPVEIPAYPRIVAWSDYEAHLAYHRTPYPPP